MSPNKEKCFKKKEQFNFEFAVLTFKKMKKTFIFGPLTQQIQP